MPPPAPAQDHQSPGATDTDAVSLSLSRYVAPSSLLLGEEEEERKPFPSLLSLRLLRNLTGAQISSANGYIQWARLVLPLVGEGGRGEKGEGGQFTSPIGVITITEENVSGITVSKRLPYWGKIVTYQYHQQIDRGRAFLSGLDDVCGSCILLAPECYRCEEERVTEASLLFPLERGREGGLYLRFLERVYRVCLVW